jgi:hypothetical protein
VNDRNPITINNTFWPIMSNPTLYFSPDSGLTSNHEGRTSRL